MSGYYDNHRPVPDPRLVHDLEPVVVGVVDVIDPGVGTAPDQVPLPDNPSNPDTGLPYPEGPAAITDMVYGTPTIVIPAWPARSRSSRPTRSSVTPR